MIDAVNNWHLPKLERIYPFQATHVESVLLPIGSTFVMGIYTAN
jgi:hypothetical protein